MPVRSVLRHGWMSSENPRVLRVPEVSEFRQSDEDFEQMLNEYSVYYGVPKYPKSFRRLYEAASESALDKAPRAFALFCRCTSTQVGTSTTDNPMELH